MRRRKIKRRDTSNPRIYKIPFLIAGVIFLLAGVVYIGGLVLQAFAPQQAVFASPYLQQNQFIGVDEKLEEKGISAEIIELSVDKTILTLQVAEGPTVIFSSKYDVDWQVSSLHSIIYKLTIDNKKPKQIDFRFGKPVVKF